jgi:hypothetical protein
MLINPKQRQNESQMRRVNDSQKNVIGMHAYTSAWFGTLYKVSCETAEDVTPSDVTAEAFYRTFIGRISISAQPMRCVYIDKFIPKSGRIFNNSFKD